MSNKKSSSSYGINFLEALLLLFVALKLIGIVDWSWWWVTLPFWGGFVVAVPILLVALYFTLKD